jgi:TRAP-type mannitol/chloroaromatic compound transport system permease small subunit
MFIALSRLIDGLNEKIAGFVSWALLAAVLICAGNALIRYIFNTSSNAWLEIQWYLYAAMFMLATAYTLKRDEHVRIDVIVGRFSRRTQVWIDLFGFAFFLLPVCLLILWYGIPFAQVSIQSQEMSSNAGGLIVWPAKLRNHQAHRLPERAHRRTRNRQARDQPAGRNRRHQGRQQDRLTQPVA